MSTYILICVSLKIYRLAWEQDVFPRNQFPINSRLCCIPHKPFAASDKIFIFIAEAKLSNFWNCVRVLIFLSINHHFQLVNDWSMGSLESTHRFNSAFMLSTPLVVNCAQGTGHLFKHFQIVFSSSGFNQAANSPKIT